MHAASRRASGAGLDYSEEETYKLVAKHTAIITNYSTDTIEQKHAAWGKQLGITAAEVRGMVLNHPTALGYDPEGDNMRRKIQFLTEVRRSLYMILAPCRCQNVIRSSVIALHI